MDNKLLIKILELLEDTYPEKYSVGILTKKLDVSTDGEFYKIIKYLKESEKVKVIYMKDASSARERLQQDDQIGITKDGIDFLATRKLTETNEKRNKWITIATIIIAIATVINLIVALFYYHIL